MLSWIEKRKTSILDDPIDRVLNDIAKSDPGTEEYSELVANLERLTRLKKEEQMSRVSPDTIAIVCGNLLGILIIVAYERSHVMASKGLNFVLRPK